jgi:transposase InsO family protein
MSDHEEPRVQERWARLRFAVVGELLAAPPARGELRYELERLTAKTWTHPSSGEPLRFGLSTIERWFYTARRSRDPVAELCRPVRHDAGTQPSLTEVVREAVRAQYGEHPGWTVQLHYDNLLARSRSEPALGELPSYATVRRFMKASGFARRRRPRATPGAARAEHRRQALETRSFEAAHVHGLWHADFHHGRRKVLLPDGSWQTPILLACLDDHSRLCCHIQWYLDETAESFVHGLSQAIQKRGLPRALMTDNGAAMRAAETTEGLARLGISHQLTLPYSPQQNAKQEILWASVEGRLMAMLEGVEDLRLDALQEATQAWVEMEYHRRLHSEIDQTPLERYLGAPHLGRPSPSGEELEAAFRAQCARTQRKSDGTLSLLGRRFEIPSRYRHFERVHVRYRGWDLSRVDLIDQRTGVVLCPLYPIDKTRNADGRRRTLAPLAAGDDTRVPSSGMAPLLAELIADYAASGLPPAYLPTKAKHDKDEDQ